MDEAWIGLLGVGIGASVTLLASVIVPWIRDSFDRRRREKEQRALELRNAVLAAEAALLHYRQEHGRGRDGAGAALATVGVTLNELTVRLSPEQQDVLDVMYLLTAMVEDRRPDIAKIMGEAMVVLNLWARGDLPIEQLISQIEERAGVEFSPDHKTVARRRRGVATPDTGVSA